jgi:hypothetical protein
MRSNIWGWQRCTAWALPSWQDASQHDGAGSAGSVCRPAIAPHSVLILVACAKVARSGVRATRRVCLAFAFSFAMFPLWCVCNKTGM